MSKIRETIYFTLKELSTYLGNSSCLALSKMSATLCALKDTYRGLDVELRKNLHYCLR